jgi:hypothetical protein
MWERIQTHAVDATWCDHCEKQIAEGATMTREIVRYGNAVAGRREFCDDKCADAFTDGLVAL